MSLREVIEKKEYIIRGIEIGDEAMNAFLFSIGCYSGERVTVMSRKRSSCIIAIKNGRYSIDNRLAKAIVV